MTSTPHHDMVIYLAADRLINKISARYRLLTGVDDSNGEVFASTLVFNRLRRHPHLDAAYMRGLDWVLDNRRN